MKFTRVVLILVLLAVSNSVFGELKIRFWSDRDGGRERFIMNRDGSDPVPDPVPDPFNVMTEIRGRRGKWLTWSPDRTKIAYGGGGEIFVMDADGSNLVNLSNKRGGDYAPRWSPDGTQVIWYGWLPIKGEGSGQRICSNNPDGTDFRDFGRGLYPKWSPDGTKIGFTLDGIPSAAMVMNADGSGRRNVTNRVQHTFFVRWAADGRNLAIAVKFHSGEWDALLVNLDDTYLTNLDKIIGKPCYGITWSPDGRRVACYSDDWKNHIYAVDVDGTNVVNLTEHHPRGSHKLPRWSPDGKEILFVTDRDGNQEVYVMNADGTNPVNLTNHPADDRSATWYGADRDLGTSVPIPQEALITTWGQIKAVISD